MEANGDQPKNWVQVLMGMVERHGVPTVLCVVVVCVAGWKGGEWIHDLTMQLKTEQAFTRDRLSEIGEKAIVATTEAKGVIQASTAQAKDVEAAIAAQTLQGNEVKAAIAAIDHTIEDVKDVLEDTNKLLDNAAQRLEAEESK